ncbi:MAG: Ig-like domain-containing protein [Sphingomonadaceae bacterium]
MSTSRASLPYHSFALETADPTLVLPPRVVLGANSSTVGPPTLSSATPADNSSAVAVGANIVLNFSNTMQASSGTVRISDGYLQSYIDKAGLPQTRWVGVTDSRIVSLNDSSQVSYSGSTVTINLSSDLKPGLTYSVTAAAGAFQDSASRPYAGLASTSKLNFTTEAVVPAQITGAIHFLDSGVSSTDYLTNIAAQTMSGTYSGVPAAGEHVMVSINNGDGWQIASAANGVWSNSSFDGPISASSTMLVRIVDANAVSRSQLSQAFVYDHTAPTITSAPALSSTNLTAAGGATVTLTFSEAVANLTVSAVATGDATSYGSFSSSDGGLTWSASVSAASATQLSSADDVLTISATDLAGNALPSANLANVFHLQHTVNTLVGLSADTGRSNSDFYTSSAAQTLSGSYLTLPASGSIRVSVDGGSSFANATINEANHSWSLATTLLNGTHAIVVEVRDATPSVTASSSHSYTLDTEAAVQSMDSVTVDLSTASDSAGASTSDDLTNVARPQVTVYTGNARTLHMGDEIQIIDVNHSNAVVGTYVLMESDLTSYGGSNFATTTSSKTFQLSQTLSDGEHQLKVQIGDLAGNAAATPSGTALSVTIDTHAPTLGAFDVAADLLNDTLVLTFDEAMSLRYPTAFTLSDGVDTHQYGVEMGNATVDGNTLILSLGHTLDADSDYQLTMNGGNITDLAGNIAFSNDDLVLEFTTLPQNGGGGTPPAAPVLSFTDTYPVTNQFVEDTDATTNALTIHVEGIEANASWSYSIGNSGWQAGSGNAFLLPNVSAAYDSGDILVKQTNAYGDSTSATVILTVDVDAPDAEVVPDSLTPLLPGAGGRQTISGYIDFSGDISDLVVEVSFDDVNWTRATLGTVTGSQIPWEVSGTTAGSIDVRITDHVGNVNDNGGFATTVGNGTDGTDTFTTDIGSTQYGGAGNDVFILDANDFNYIDGGSGNDILSFAFNHHSFDPSTAAGDFMTGIDTINLGANQHNILVINNQLDLSLLTDNLSDEHTLLVLGDSTDGLELTHTGFALTSTDSNYHYYDFGHLHLIVANAVVG